MLPKLDKLTDFDKNLLLYWFFHHLEMDQREKMMMTLPLQYGKAMGNGPHDWGIDIRDAIHNWLREI